MITSGRSKIVLDTLICTKKGLHGYQNGPYCVSSSFLILSKSCWPFFMSSHDFWAFKKFLWCRVGHKNRIFTNSPASHQKMTLCIEFARSELIMSQNIKVTSCNLHLLSYPHNVNLKTRLRRVETLYQVRYHEKNVKNRKDDLLSPNRCNW